MKRTKLALVGAALLAATAMPVLADGGAKLGLGYFRTNAPIGARYWFTDKVAGDVGIGLNGVPLTDNNGAQSTKVGFALDVGIPIVLMGDEHTMFFFRPGFAYQTNPTSYDNTNSLITSKTLWISGDLGVEHFIGKKFSVEVAHGIMYQSYDSGVTNSKKLNSFMTEGLGVTSLGFHYYFWPN